MGKGRQNTKFRTLYFKSRGETNSVWANESVRNNRTLFSETASLKCYPRRPICIIFKMKENMKAALRG
jgi:hypothetical protein